jgi:hypothetical protein
MAREMHGIEIVSNRRSLPWPEAGGTIADLWRIGLLEPDTASP